MCSSSPAAACGSSSATPPASTSRWAGATSRCPRGRTCASSSPRRAPHAPAADRSLTARPRAIVVVTGSELVRGERTDLNGPFLAREALKHGLEPARIAIVGDAPEELEAALRDGLAADVCLVSGGLGPTHDDRTVEMVAKALGLALHVDAELEAQIGRCRRRRRRG